MHWPCERHSSLCSCQSGEGRCFLGFWLARTHEPGHQLETVMCNLPEPHGRHPHPGRRWQATLGRPRSLCNHPWSWRNFGKLSTQPSARTPTRIRWHISEGRFRWATTTPRMGPCHQTSPGGQTSWLQDISAVTRSTAWVGYIHRGEPNFTADLSFQVSPCISILLHTKERQLPSPLSRLPIPQFHHDQEQIPITTHRRSHQQTEKCDNLHQIWHLLGVQ